MMTGDVERIRDALHFIPANNRDTWVKLAMAVKCQLGDAGFDVWDEWSQGDESYNAKDARDVWKSIKLDGGVTIGTLFHEAQQHGFKLNGTRLGPLQPLTHEEIAERKQRAEQREREKEQAQVAAATRTTEILEAATGDPATHPYAVKKRVPLGPRVKRGHWPQRGWKDAVLVPIFQSDGNVWSIEAINFDGEKDSLKEGKKRGGFHHFGRITGALRVLIGEGLATVAAGVEADGSPAMAALSRNNVKTVAELARERAAPGAVIVLLADFDPKADGTNPGLASAIDAAQACGGVIAIPHMGGVKCDFWDVWDRDGAEAVRQAIASASTPASAEHDPAGENVPPGDPASPDRPEPPAPDAATSGNDGKSEHPTTAKVLIDIAVKNCDLFHDERNDGHAVTTHNGVRCTLKLRSREFRRWLAGSYYAATDRAANNEAQSTALQVLEAKATFDGPQLELANRFAMRDDAIYIDMGDAKWRVVKITANGWEIMTKPPVLFRRYSHQQALPDPVRGGKLAELHRHLAIKSDDDKRLVEAWLVAAAFQHIPRPAIDFYGPQGAAKSTSARALKSITDPSVTESVDLGKSPADLAQVLDHHGVACFDNLSSIPPWAADMLCRAVTGGAFSKRELYSDDSDILLTFKRPIIITGINIPTHAPDLLDRLVLIELERIKPENRVDEATFWKEFDADRPKLFGALLDAIAGTLQYLPCIKLDRMPRMADFARVACAYAEFAGVGAEKMLDIIMRHTSRQTQEVLDADPVASAVREFIQKRGVWTGTAGDLLKLLNESQPAPRPDGWPRQANSLSRRLNVLHSTLNEVGISVRRRKDGDRLLTLESSPDSSSASSTPSESPIHAPLGADDRSRPSSWVSSALNPSIHAGLDDTDDQDGNSACFSTEGDSVAMGADRLEAKRWAR